MKNEAISVSDFNALINQTLSFAYPEVVIEGEVSSFKLNHNKWVFFDLKDNDNSVVNCFMMVFQLRTAIEDGMLIRVRATPKLTNWGKFSLTVHEIELAGEGSVKRAFEMLKAKKKVKPASVLVAKMKYRPDWADLNINSIDPKGIIGASQLWVINAKTRNLSVYHAVDSNGLSVRGSTITGFEEATSITKKVRKPREVLPQVLTLAKVPLRQVMKDLKTAETKANGRINADTILLRVLK